MPRLPFGDLGPGIAIWAYGESGEREFHSVGRISLKKTSGWKKVEEERYGDAAVDGVHSGSEVELTIPIARAELEELAIILGTEIDGDELPIKSRVGCPMYDDSKPIVIKPICDNVMEVNPDAWVLLYHCYPIDSWELGWARDGQRVFNIVFVCFVAQESPYTGEFGTIGVNT